MIFLGERAVMRPLHLHLINGLPAVAGNFACGVWIVLQPLAPIRSSDQDNVDSDIQHLHMMYGNSRVWVIVVWFGTIGYGILMCAVGSGYSFAVQICNPQLMKQLQI